MAHQALMACEMRRLTALVLVCAAIVPASACRRRSAAADVPSERAQPAATGVKHAPAVSSDSGPRRDLSYDESLGGHTLARHVARTDADLAERLEGEHISAASTYTDRATAELAVGAALAANDRKLASWEHRTGRRPNLVLHYEDRSAKPFGRSLFRGTASALPCDRALVVLRWDDRRDRAYVLTSYPDCVR